MRAIRIHGAGEVAVETVPRPVPGDGELLLQVTGAGLCGTDAALFRHGRAIIPPGSAASWPIVLGHEFAGRVVEVGAGVSRELVGELVASGAGVSCGVCAACAEGRTNLCESYWTAGVHRDGGLAEYCVVPAAICEPAREHGVDGDAVALAQPMAIAHHAVTRGRLRDGERALILGAGGIGAFATWVAVQLGAEVTVCDRDAVRLAIARGLGAATTVATTAEPLVEQLAPHGPWDVVYEMTGAAEPLAAAIALVRPGGRVVAAGVQTTPPPIDAARVALQEIDLLGTMALVRATDLPRALSLLGARAQGWSDIAPVLLSLEEVVDEALPMLVAGTSPRIKTLADPSASASRPFLSSADSRAA